MKTHAFNDVPRRLTPYSMTVCLSVLLVSMWSIEGPIPCRADPPAPLPAATPDRLPRWRGFNLTEKFHRDWSNGPFLESDFQWIHELGFNFVRLIVPWQEAEQAGIGVIVGEFGSYNKTPHDVALRWLEDSLANWEQAGWGWALWNFRGSFGILDSGREDVEYEDFHGHKLDRKMLELLRRY